MLMPTQVLWTFSIYLEAVAILPQLVLLQRTQNIDNLTGNYVFLLGCATLFPALNRATQIEAQKLLDLAAWLEHQRLINSPTL